LTARGASAEDMSANSTVRPADVSVLTLKKSRIAQRSYNEK